MERNTFVELIDLSTRQKRRDATKLAVSLINQVYLAENNYRGRISSNSGKSAVYCANDETCDYLAEAIFALKNASKNI